MQHCCLLHSPAEHIKGIFLFATRLYSWLLNPVGGEEHSTEMITEVNLQLHSFLPDPEHFDREKPQNSQLLPGSCTISSYCIFFFTFFSIP